MPTYYVVTPPTHTLPGYSRGTRVIQNDWIEYSH